MRQFRPYDPDQPFLLPPRMQDWLPEDHLARFVSDVVDVLDLAPVLDCYHSPQHDGRGQPGYHPLMMVKLLVYGYCTGVRSSRKIEQATWDSLPFRVLAADQHPDHDSIAAFRRRHLEALSGLFVEVLQLCEQAGLVKLGDVAVDGSKYQANASKHKAMSYGRMVEREAQLRAEIAALLAEAEAADRAEAAEAREGAADRQQRLPEELRRREGRLAKVQAAKAALEEQARAKAEEEAVAVQEKLAERARKEQERGKRLGGRPPVAPDPAQAWPDPKAQRNFTDPESRIMKDGATGSFVQGYNCQVGVDGCAQVIVARAVTQQAADQQQLVPLLRQVQENLGRLPERGLGDGGYYSTPALSDPALAGVELYVPPNRLPGKGAGEGEGSVAEQMRARLGTPEGKAVYARRKGIVEPVFGQTKEGQGFRRFSFRGLALVTWEWDLVCLTHNLLKLFRSGWRQKQGAGQGALAAA